MKYNKFRKIVIQANRMRKIYKTSNRMLSVTLVFTISMIIGALLVIDTMLLNQYKYYLRFPDNLAQILHTDDFTKIFVDLIEEENLVVQWYQKDVSLEQYRSEKQNVESTYTYIPFQFQESLFIENQVPQKMKLVEGRMFYYEDFIEEQNIVIIDKSTAKLFYEESAINQNIFLTMSDKENEEEYLKEYKIVGIVDDLIYSDHVSRQNDVTTYYTRFYLPYRENQDATITTHYSTIISDDIQRISMMADTNRIELTSSYKMNKLLLIEKVKNAWMKLILVAVISVILFINLFGVLKNIVKERYPEMGLLQAIGVEKKDILLQLLIELIILIAKNIVISIAIIGNIALVIKGIVLLLFGKEIIFYLDSLSIGLIIVVILLQMIAYPLLQLFFALQVDVLKQIRNDD